MDVKRRNYGQACSLALALDHIGERWALLIVRELSLGPLRFSDLGRAIGGAPPDVLTRRLRDLEAAGIVDRRELGPPVSGTVYELTEIGRKLEQPMLELGRWGMNFYSIDEARQVTSTTLPNALRVILKPSAEADFTVGLRTEGQVYRLRIGEGRIEGARAEPENADLVLSGKPLAILSYVVSDEIGEELEDDESVQVEGDTDLVGRLRAMVSIPDHLRPRSEGAGEPVSLSAATARSA